MWRVERTYEDFRSLRNALTAGGNKLGLEHSMAGVAQGGIAGSIASNLARFGRRVFGGYGSDEQSADGFISTDVEGEGWGDEQSRVVAAAAKALPALPPAAPLARDCIGARFLAARRAALAQWFEAVLEDPHLRACPATAAFVSECSADWADFLRPL